MRRNGDNEPPDKAGRRHAWESILLGVLSLVPFCVTGLLGIPAILSGRSAVRLAKEHGLPQKVKTLGLVGLFLGIFGIGLNGFIAWSVVNAAKQLAIKTQCASNLKQVGLAMRIWEGDHRDRLPNSYLELTNELGNSLVLTCPSDSTRLKLRRKTANQWDPALFSYDFLLPGRTEAETTNRVIIRCPIHGLVVLGNGSVEDERMLKKQ